MKMMWWCISCPLQRNGKHNSVHDKYRERAYATLRLDSLLKLLRCEHVFNRTCCSVSKQPTLFFFRGSYLIILNSSALVLSGSKRYRHSLVRRCCRVLKCRAVTPQCVCVHKRKFNTVFYIFYGRHHTQPKAHKHNTSHTALFSSHDGHVANTALVGGICCWQCCNHVIL